MKFPSRPFTHPRFSAAALSILLPAAALTLLPGTTARASGPTISQDQGADLADVYFFLDPNDNTKVFLGLTVHGFIVPGEVGNFAAFDPNVRYLFELENSGDATADAFIRVRFDARTSSLSPQTATVTLPNGREFTAPTTPPTFGKKPNAPVITHDDATNVDFFAGEQDDPFFFDLAAFERFAASAAGGQVNPAILARSRDTFAGYNILTIALRLPASLLRGPAGNTVGASAVTQRGTQTPSADGGYVSTGPFRQVDRVGVPAVNMLFIPFGRQDAYNAATPEDQAAGKFTADIRNTLRGLGTDDLSASILTSIAVTRGDYLRLDLSIANSGPGGGTNPSAGFPNGRRLNDDVMDTLLTLVANRNFLGDGVNRNDVPLRDQFPFFAPPQQPRKPASTEDNTRN